ncbi:MAG: helix-turn-helix domain-containing protein, partial [Chloroflexota bacterium]|nr:helix-turn-helix domain-containing protein [Chloroflexota bacterium]
RESRRATRTRAADTFQVSQANVSRIEHQEDLYLSTLRDYVAELGGRLEIAAVFPDETIICTPPSRERAAGDSARAEGVAATEEIAPEVVQPVRPSQGQRALPDE